MSNRNDTSMKDDYEVDKDSGTSQPPPKKRRRVPEACHVCRRRKAKCDGGRPCSYCKNTNQECVFDPSHPVGSPLDRNFTGSINDVVRNLQERVKFLESKMGAINTPHEVTNTNRAWNMVQQNIVQQRTPQDNNTLFIEFGAGVSTVNSGTRNIEFYGATSSYAFAAARALFHNTNAPAKISALSPSHNSPASSKESPDNATKFVSIEDIGMEELLASNDTPMPDNFDGFMSFSGPSLYDNNITLNDPFLERRDIIDRHVDSFFNTVHPLLPILHEGAFRKLYGVFWKEIERKEIERKGNRRESEVVEIGRDALDAGVMPLVFAVACHGALYSADTDDQREWARGYFARARRWLSVFESGSFETMIAMYLLATYAQHVFKQNLAYNYLGLAIRLSYSIGLHVFNPGTSEKTIATAACWPGVSKPILGEMAKRIWWSMYALEVESSLNCGRPMCIRNQDIYIGDPSLFDDEYVTSSETDIQAVPPTQPTLINYLIEMAKFSRIVRKVLKVSYSAESTKLSFPVWTEELHNLTQELAQWQESLPIWLRTAKGDDFDEPSWMSRQRESIQYHCKDLDNITNSDNHVLLTMYREFLNLKKPFSHPKLSSETGVQKCVEAARGNIVLIHDCLMANPSLRIWTHLYYYMLSASLVFIDRLNQAPFDQRALDYTRCCGLATKVFEWMRPLGGSDKIVVIIKNCLEEWQNRRDARAAAIPTARKQPDLAQEQMSDGDVSETYEISRGADSPDYPRARSTLPMDTPNSTRSASPSNSPIQTVFLPRNKTSTNNDSYVGSQYLHFTDSPNPTAFINQPFLQDIYLASNFGHANTIALMPGSPYEPLTALLNSDIAPNMGSGQLKVANGTKTDNRFQNGTRQEEDEPMAGYYNPSERIEKMFGISPPWRDLR